MKLCSSQFLSKFLDRLLITAFILIILDGLPYIQLPNMLLPAGHFSEIRHIPIYALQIKYGCGGCVSASSAPTL